MSEDLQWRRVTKAEILSKFILRSNHAQNASLLISSVASRHVHIPLVSAWSSQMSTAKKNLCLYIVDCVRVISISRPMERCSRTLNSAARLVTTNCKKVGPKCSADDNTKYWHKCPKNKNTIVYLNLFHPRYMNSDRSRDEAENRRKSKTKFCKKVGRW